MNQLTERYRFYILWYVCLPSMIKEYVCKHLNPPWDDCSIVHNVNLPTPLEMYMNMISALPLSMFVQLFMLFPFSSCSRAQNQSLTTERQFEFEIKCIADVLCLF